MLMELAFKGLTNDQLINRTCSIINHIMLPECKANHMRLLDSGCNPSTGQRPLKYVWLEPKNCKGGIPLLQPIILPCSYVPPWIPVSTTCNILAIITILIGFTMLFLFHYFREEKAIRKANQAMSSLVLLGAIVCASSVFFMTGNPEYRGCGTEYIVLAYGFALSTGALFMKVH
jgi:hypothetical protein